MKLHDYALAFFSRSKHVRQAGKHLARIRFVRRIRVSRIGRDTVRLAARRLEIITPRVNNRDAALEGELLFARNERPLSACFILSRTLQPGGKENAREKNAAATDEILLLREFETLISSRRICLMNRIHLRSFFFVFSFTTFLSF